MLDLPYNQFTGTVQVMKAVGNHLVLTFCETLPRSQIFTIILTRKPHLLSRDVNINKKSFADDSLKDFLTGGSIGQKSLTSSGFECAISKKSLQELSDSRISERDGSFHTRRFINSQSKVLNFSILSFCLSQKVY